MPKAKSIPPSEPLPPALQERVVAFKTYTTGHARLAQVDDALTQAIWEPGGFAFLLLYGPTGVGKSVLLRSVTSRMQARAQVVTPGDKLPRPVILVETPAPFTYREWYERVLLALDEPIIEERIYREVGGAGSGKGATRGRASSKLLEEAPELRRAVEVALARRKVQAILLDEAQHLLTNGETGDLKRRWDWLKSLTNTTGVLYVKYNLNTRKRWWLPTSTPCDTMKRAELIMASMDEERSYARDPLGVLSAGGAAGTATQVVADAKQPAISCGHD